MILRPASPTDGDETADAVRLYREMWSIERIAALFATDYDAMRRLIARHTALRHTDKERHSNVGYG